MTGRALVLRGDARQLPLPDESVDLIATSPPFYALRSYTDDGEHYEGQIGSEPTPGEYIGNLLACVAEWVRVLKPTGSIWLNLGDKFGRPGGGVDVNPRSLRRAGKGTTQRTRTAIDGGGRDKCLMGLPWRVALRCMDELGLILRQDQIWSKVNGIPESVADRTRRSHEYWFHFVRQERYYSAVDEIREPHTRAWGGSPNGGHTYAAMKAPGEKDSNLVAANPNPLGKLPGSVWEIPSEPLVVPDHIAHARCCAGAKRPGCEDGLAHYAAFPTEWPLRIIHGWSPPGICAGCGEGRRPVADTRRIPLRPGDAPGRAGLNGDRAHGFDRRAGTHALNETLIVGYACACTPYTDHPGAGSTTRRSYSPGPRDNNAQGTYGRHQAGEYSRVGPWREYHFDGWTPPPTTQAVVVDPFGGTGTTALVARAYGRIGITIDRSADYGLLAAWRTTDPEQLAKAMRVEKPPQQLDGQEALFDLAAG